MGHYRKRPVVIEAVKVTDVLWYARRDWSGLPAWLREAYETGDVILLNDAVEVQTREGAMRGEATAWIIRGVSGELYPCQDDIFRATYDEVPATTPPTEVAP